MDTASSFSPPRRGLLTLSVAVATGLVFVSILGAGMARAVAPVAPASEVAVTIQEEEVLMAVSRFFEGMAAGDPEMVREVVFPEGQFFRVRVADDGSQVGISTIQSLIETVADPEVELLERIWDPEVRIHGRLATVWAPYDFYRDGEFSHCGVDAFNMIETDAGWKLANAAYTVEPTGCEPSPLGPPRR